MAYKDLIPYNKMSQWASDNGGPAKAMEMVEKTNQLIGERRGVQKDVYRGLV